MITFIEKLKIIRRSRNKISEYISAYGKKCYPNRNALFLYLKIIRSYLFEDCLFVEFFWYHWQSRTRTEGKSFVYAMEREKLLSHINPSNCMTILTNKWETYKYFEPYYKRKVWLNGKGLILSELSKSRKDGGVCLFFKPLDKNCGRGIKSFVVYSEDDIKRIGEEYSGNYIVEELVVQHPLVGNLHPESVNTLRINTCLLSDNSVFVFAPVLRIGCGGAVVDNAGAGGIIAALDKNTGKVLACGDERCNTYVSHPNTGIPLVGYQIPEYEAAVILVKELALKLPELKLIGWDLAYTNDGWVLIEANGNPNFLWQIATKKGIRDDFEMIKKKVQ